MPIYTIFALTLHLEKQQNVPTNCMNVCMHVCVYVCILCVCVCISSSSRKPQVVVIAKLTQMGEDTAKMANKTTLKAILQTWYVYSLQIEEKRKRKDTASG